MLPKIREYSPFLDSAGPNLICAYSMRCHNNMSLFYGDTRESINNRKNFLQGIGIDLQDLVCAKQIHSSSVRFAKEEDRGRGALSYESSLVDTDALVTDRRKLPLAIFTADCLSIFLYDPIRPAIGLSHAGWRSTKEKIVAKTVQSMQQYFNTVSSNLYVVFGPAIRSCCYEVGENFQDIFPDDLIRRNGLYYLDLVQINKRQLLQLGVKENSIFDSRICTSCRNSDFFSYRKEGKGCGRMISVIMLR